MQIRCNKKLFLNFCFDFVLLVSTTFKILTDLRISYKCIVSHHPVYKGVSNWKCTQCESVHRDNKKVCETLRADGTHLPDTFSHKRAVLTLNVSSTVYCREDRLLYEPKCVEYALCVQCGDRAFEWVTDNLPWPVSHETFCRSKNILEFAAAAIWNEIFHHVQEKGKAWNECHDVLTFLCLTLERTLCVVWKINRNIARDLISVL